MIALTNNYRLRTARLPVRKLIAWIVLGAFALCGCGERQAIQTPPRQQAEKTQPVANNQPAPALVADKLPPVETPRPSPATRLQADNLPKATEIEPVFSTGDVVRIEVVGESELTREVTVPRDGTVAYPLLKTVDLRGKTVRQLTQDLTARLAEYLVDPVVNVAIVQIKERMAYVYGDGISRTIALSPYEINLASRILLGLGSNSDIDWSEVAIVRKNDGNRQTFRLDLTKLLENYEAESDIVVQTGDVIVLQKSPKVYVQGAVNAPGTFAIQKNQQKTLGEIFLLAQGAATDADLEHVKILRQDGQNKRRVVFATASKADYGYGSNTLVQANDIVIVPSQASNFVTVYGEIKTPGTVKLSGKSDRLATVLAKAGGLTEYASKWISIIRYLPGGESKKISVNYNSMVAGEAEHDIEVVSQDVIFIDSSIW